MQLERIKANQTNRRLEKMTTKLIDIHTHGALGFDTMDFATDPAAQEKIGAWHKAAGVDFWCATTVTSPLEKLKAVTSVKPAFGNVGYHVEGPFLSPAAKGAHEENLLLLPTRENISFITSNPYILRVTIAPDLQGAANAVSAFVAAGKQVSLGHENATDEQIYECIEAGATSVTHITNCTSTLARRGGIKKHVGLSNIGLIDDRLTVEVIADGVHVPDEYFRLILKAKGADKICLVSDSLSVAGKKSGKLVNQNVSVRDGVGVLESGTVAGSVTSIKTMADRLVAKGICTREEAVIMISTTPARLLRLKL
jgi:N-acetylglucosamine-6-phosphate deacetylase